MEHNIFLAKSKNKAQWKWNGQLTPKPTIASRLLKLYGVKVSDAPNERTKLLLIPDEGDAPNLTEDENAVLPDNLPYTTLGVWLQKLDDDKKSQVGSGSSSNSTVGSGSSNGSRRKSSRSASNSRAKPLLPRTIVPRSGKTDATRRSRSSSKQVRSATNAFKQQPQQQQHDASKKSNTNLNNASKQRQMSNHKSRSHSRARNQAGNSAHSRSQSHSRPHSRSRSRSLSRPRNNATTATRSNYSRSRPTGQRGPNASNNNKTVTGSAFSVESKQGGSKKAKSVSRSASRSQSRSPSSQSLLSRSQSRGGSRSASRSQSSRSRSSCAPDVRTNTNSGKPAPPSSDSTQQKPQKQQQKQQQKRGKRSKWRTLVLKDSRNKGFVSDGKKLTRKQVEALLPAILPELRIMKRVSRQVNLVILPDGTDSVDNAGGFHPKMEQMHLSDFLKSVKKSVSESDLVRALCAAEDGGRKPATATATAPTSASASSASTSSSSNNIRVDSKESKSGRGKAPNNSDRSVDSASSFDKPKTRSQNKQKDTPSSAASGATLHIDANTPYMWLGDSCHVCSREGALSGRFNTQRDFMSITSGVRDVELFNDANGGTLGALVRVRDDNDGGSSSSRKLTTFDIQVERGNNGNLESLSLIRRKK